MKLIVLTKNQKIKAQLKVAKKRNQKLNQLKMKQIQSQIKVNISSKFKNQNLKFYFYNR